MCYTTYKLLPSADCKFCNSISRCRSPTKLELVGRTVRNLSNDRAKVMWQGVDCTIPAAASQSHGVCRMSQQQTPVDRDKQTDID